MLFAFAVPGMAQQNERPPEGTLRLLNKDCSYPRQLEKKEIIKDEQLHQTIFREDSLSMTVFDSVGSARMELHYSKYFLPGKEEVEMPLDSVTTLLFRNGLLTPGLLINVFNKTLFFIDSKGDSTLIEKHTDARSLQLYSIHQVSYAPKFKIRNRRKELRLSIAVVLEGSNGTIYQFELLLNGTRTPSPASLKQYLEKASIKCLRYEGFQI